MKHIVVVDDEPDIVDAVEMVISDQNTDVVTFVSAKEAFSYIKDNTSKINLIICDISMPEMSGIDILKNQINIHWIPFIFLTAISDNKTVEAAFNYKDKVLSLNYISKPFNPVVLKSLVDSMLLNQQFFLEIESKNRKITRLLDTISSQNITLSHHVANLLEDKEKEQCKFQQIKTFMNDLVNNDLLLIKFVLKIIETNKDRLANIIGEGDELFRVLPKTVEPLQTAISDIITVANVLVSMGILSITDLKNKDIKKTHFYNLLENMYMEGEFDTETFEEFVNMVEFSEFSSQIENGNDDCDSGIILF